MRDFREIITILKLHLEKERPNKRIYDKDVAKMLGIEQSKFATIKKRNSTPYVALLCYCKREGICCNEIFFD